MFTSGLPWRLRPPPFSFSVLHGNGGNPAPGWGFPVIFGSVLSNLEKLVSCVF